MKDTNRSFGYSKSGIAIVKKGHYTRSTKLTIIVTIEPGSPNVAANIPGSITKPRIWFSIHQRGGTTVEMYREHIQHVVNSFDENEPMRVFLHDNLSSHLHQTVTDVIVGDGHSVITRPPYCPCDGPIEYFFNYLEKRLRHCNQDITTIADLRHVLTVLLNNPGQCDGYFSYCGYLP